jgi:hypothetical protein
MRVPCKKWVTENWHILFAVSIVVPTFGSVLWLGVTKTIDRRVFLEACEAACSPDVVMSSYRNHCECVEPGKDGKRYVVRPKETP